MKIDEIQKEFEQMAQRRAQADAAFKANDFNLAVDLYNKALKLLEKNYSDDHPDVYSSLLNLADSYCSVRRHNESLPCYERVLSVQMRGLAPDQTDQAFTLFKIAKACDRCDIIDRATEYYERTIVAVMRDLPKGHRLNSIVRESYAGMLRRVQYNERALELEEEAKVMRKQIHEQRNLASTILQGMGDDAELPQDDPVPESAPSRTSIDYEGLDLQPTAQKVPRHGSALWPLVTFLGVVAVAMFASGVFLFLSFPGGSMVGAPPSKTAPAEVPALVEPVPVVTPAAVSSAVKTSKNSSPSPKKHKRYVRPIETGGDPWGDIRRDRSKFLR